VLTGGTATATRAGVKTWRFDLTSRRNGDAVFAKDHYGAHSVSTKGAYTTRTINAPRNRLAKERGSKPQLITNALFPIVPRGRSAGVVTALNAAKLPAIFASAMVTLESRV
jgi:hypothetical protein